MKGERLAGKQRRCWGGPGGRKTGARGSGSGEGLGGDLGLCRGVWEGLGFRGGGRKVSE